MSWLIPESERLRLLQLQDLARRELDHLQQTDARLFSEAWTPAELRQRCQNIDFAERVDAFVARFGRLQDLLGDKFLPAYLRAMQEPAAAMLQNLDRGERLGLIRSADEWVALRQLRNRLIHEYQQSDADLHAALMAAHQGVPALQHAVERLCDAVAQRVGGVGA